MSSPLRRRRVRGRSGPSSSGTSPFQEPVSRRRRRRPRLLPFDRLSLPPSRPRALPRSPRRPGEPKAWRCRPLATARRQQPSGLLRPGRSRSGSKSRPQRRRRSPPPTCPQPGLRPCRSCRRPRRLPPCRRTRPACPGGRGPWPRLCLAAPSHGCCAQEGARANLPMRPRSPVTRCQPQRARRDRRKFRPLSLPHCNPHCRRAS